MNTIVKPQSIQEKLEIFTQELTNISREFEVIIDVGSDSSNNIHFFTKNGHGEFLTLEKILKNKEKFRDLIWRLENLFKSTGFILDSSDYVEGCVPVIRNHKTRVIIAYLEYIPYDAEEQQLTTYSFIRKK